MHQNDTPPTPGEKSPGHDERDESKVREDNGVSDEFEVHSVRRAVSESVRETRDGRKRMAVLYGALRVRPAAVHAPS